MMFVCLLWSASFLTYLRPTSDSFFLISLVPPQMTKKSFRHRRLISQRATLVTLSSLEPSITVPVTSNVLLSEDERLDAQPLAWLSPIIRILFFHGLERQLFLVFTGVVFPTFLILPLVELTPLTITGIVSSISSNTRLGNTENRFAVLMIWSLAATVCLSLYLGYESSSWQVLRSIPSN